MKIGIPDFDFRRNDYAYIRNIIRVPDFEYLPVEDIIGCMWYKTYRSGSDIPLDIKSGLKFNLDITKDIQGALRFIFYDADYSYLSHKVHVLHFFDGLSLGSAPWVSTCESMLPYNFKNQDNDLFRLAIDKIAGPSCKKVMFLSKNAMARQKEYLKGFPDERSVIEKKSEVLYPPQYLLVRNIDDKKIEYTNELKFIFVGGHFFRKGGRPMLEAFLELKRKGLPIKLTIITSFKQPDIGDGFPSGEEAVVWAKKIIKENEGWINLKTNVPLDELNQLYRDHHVGVFPTFYDTFGYVSLEMMSAGMPVITTNVRALPEIVDRKNGWMIDLPVNDLGAPIWTTPEKMHLLVKDGIISAVEEAFSNTRKLEKRASAALDTIDNKFNPSKHAARLKQIYVSAFRS